MMNENTPSRPDPTHSTAKGRVLSRRTFVGGLAGLAGLAWSGVTYPASPRGSGPRRVAVVGAGLAGLAAATKLAEAGLDVVVLEGSQRAGGRIRTLRGVFADGLEPEAGGDEIGATYKTVLRYVRELGLSVVPGEGPAALLRSDILVELGMDRHRLSELRKDPSTWGSDLKPDEARRAPFGLLYHHVGSLAREMASPKNTLDAKWLEYDKLSLSDLLRQRGASTEARRLIEVALNYNHPDTVSALSVLRDITRRFGDPGSFHIEGGNDQLPTGLAARLGERVRYGKKLRRVRWSDSGADESSAAITLSLESHGDVEELKADAVVLAIPFTALRHVDFDPGLPEAREQVIQELPYTQVTKTYVQARRRFWSKDLGIAAVWSDGAFERIFGSSLEGSGSRALLLSWLNGQGAQDLARDEPGEQAKKVIANMARIFPEQAQLLEHGVTIDWSREPSRGAYAHFAPGQIRAFGELIPKPVGALHFAGEHTELVAPGMEGALVSGHRAADEILATP